jgi:hypothetical protein
MATGWQAALNRLLQWLRYWLYIRRGQYLPCDSLSPKLCYACHKLRGILTDTHRFPHDIPVIIGTQHGQYIIGAPVNAQKYGDSIIVAYGHTPLSPFIEHKLKEMIKHDQQPDDVFP